VKTINSNFESSERQSKRLLTAQEFALKYFDANYYRGRYPDLKSEDHSELLAHWLSHGYDELRNPHPLVDLELYLTNYTDVQTDPLGHYLRHGWIEGRSISHAIYLPTFGDLNPEWSQSGVSQLEFVCEAIRVGREVVLDENCVLTGPRRSVPETEEILLALSRLNGYSQHHVRVVFEHFEKHRKTAEDFSNIEIGKCDWVHFLSIILPIHIDHPTTRRLLDDLGRVNTKFGAHVIVVLDGCSEKEFVEYVRKFQNSNFRILENSIAKGFAASVNEAAELIPENHEIAILNSDIALRLQTLTVMYEQLAKTPRLASVTALTNHGSIASYPFANREMKILNFDALELSKMFEILTPHSETLNLPTCVGHCVLIRHKAWNDVGGFDSLNFPEGYGEEVDWSLRAAKKGWGHALSMRAFVWHEGSVSFGSRKRELKERAESLLSSVHGDSYSALKRETTDFLDKLGLAYAEFEAQVLGSQSGRLRCLIVHEYGGGTFEFIERNRLRSSSETLVVVFVSTDKSTFRCGIDQINFPNLASYEFRIDQLHKILRLLSPQNIELHTAVGSSILELYFQLLNFGKILDIYLHDYAPFCRRINLFGGLGHREKYCGVELDEDTCDACVQKFGSRTGSSSTRETRYLARELFEKARSVVVPSAESQKIWQRWGIKTGLVDHSTDNKAGSGSLERKLDRVHCASAKRQVEAARRPRLLRTQPCILIPGRISDAKGAVLVHEVAALNRIYSSPLRLILCGEIDWSTQITPNGFSMIIGDYVRQLPQLVASITTSAIWVSTLWPETHMYVVDDLLSLDKSIPVVLNTDAGAHSRRLRSSGFRVTVCEPEPTATLRTLCKVSKPF
jgi:GT2 family glycosyltransferase